MAMSIKTRSGCSRSINSSCTIKAASIIPHDQFQPPPLIGPSQLSQFDNNMFSIRVPDYVGQRFLRNAKRGGLNIGWNRELYRFRGKPSNKSAQLRLAVNIPPQSGHKPKVVEH